jgi:hypothetical protein
MLRKRTLVVTDVSGHFGPMLRGEAVQGKFPIGLLNPLIWDRYVVPKRLLYCLTLKMGRIGFSETALGLLNPWRWDRYVVPKRLLYCLTLKMGRIGFPETCLGLLNPWRWDRYVVPKCLLYCLTLKMGRIGFPETSLGLLDPENWTDSSCRNAGHWESVLRNIPEEQRCRLQRSGSLQSLLYLGFPTRHCVGTTPGTPCLMPRPQVLKWNEMLPSSLFFMTIYAQVGCADVKSIVVRDVKDILFT